MDDVELLTEDGVRLSIEAFVDDELAVVERESAVYAIVCTDEGEHELYRIVYATVH